MGKGVFNESDFRFVGNIVLLDNDFVYCVIECVDFIINVGYDVVEKLFFFMYYNGKKVIYINFEFVVVDLVYFF